nr:agmatine deiminase family protein [uncultured Carboxylicivirga sp.]
MREFPAEWYEQSAVQLTWPDASTDWNDILEEVIPVFKNIADEISEDQKVLIVAQDVSAVRHMFDGNVNVVVVESEINDTWARDHGGISVFEDGKPVLLDFGFNAWGNKFEFNKDNDITQRKFKAGVFKAEVEYSDNLDFILEGGSVESDGKGTILTTSECLLSLERNPQLSKQDIENELKKRLGAKRVLWLDNGYLAGDDTDSHIDTLARLISEDTIAYVACDDVNDEHYNSLKAMETELKDFRKVNGEPYRLVKLPMADVVYDEDDRLPATYANFLIINKKVLVPFYNSPKDEEVSKIMAELYPDREIVGINCLPLIKQHGSLHCITMQYPKEFVK